MTTEAVPDQTLVEQRMAPISIKNLRHCIAYADALSNSELKEPEATGLRLLAANFVYDALTKASQHPEVVPRGVPRVVEILGQDDVDRETDFLETAKTILEKGKAQLLLSDNTRRLVVEQILSYEIS